MVLLPQTVASFKKRLCTGNKRHCLMDQRRAVCSCHLIHKDN
jgi:hypothetical protein